MCMSPWRALAALPDPQAANPPASDSLEAVQCAAVRRRGPQLAACAWLGYSQALSSCLRQGPAISPGEVALQDRACCPEAWPGRPQGRGMTMDGDEPGGRPWPPSLLECQAGGRSSPGCQKGDGFILPANLCTASGCCEHRPLRWCDIGLLLIGCDGCVGLQREPHMRGRAVPPEQVKQQCGTRPAGGPGAGLWGGR